MSDLRAQLFAWLLERTTGELEGTALLDGLASRLTGAGFDLHRVSIWIPTKHPELWGHQLIWVPATGAALVQRLHAASFTTEYVGTPAESLYQSGELSGESTMTSLKRTGRVVVEPT